MMNVLCQICVYGFLLFGLSDSLLAKEPSYRRVLSKWTASDTDYARSDSMANLAATATYLSEAWFDARVQSYAKENNLSADEKESYEKTLAARFRKEPTLFLAFYTRDKLWNTLDRDTKKTENGSAQSKQTDALEEPLWRLRLENNGTMCEPKRVSKIKKVSPEERYFFPYLNRWDSAYWVTFPETCVTDETGKLVLRIDGVYA